MPLFNKVKIDLSPNRWIYGLFCGALFVLPMGTSPFTILGVGILAIWIITGEFIKKRHGYLKTPWFFPVLAMVVLVWLGLIYTPDLHGLGLKFAKKSHYWLYALAVASISFNRKSADILIRSFLSGLFLNAVVGFLQLGNIVPTFSTWGAYKYTGFNGGYNTLAIFLVLGMMTASFYFRIALSKKEKKIHALLILVYFAHLVILEGRGGYITFAFLSPIMVHNLTQGRHLWVKFLVYPLAIGIMFSSPILRKRVTQATENLQLHLYAGGDFTSGKKYSENFDRVYMWRWAIALFMKHPFLGVGTGGYGQAILSEGGDKAIAHPHNNFLYMAVSFGMLGLFVIGWLFWVLLKKGWQKRHIPIGFFIMSSSLVILVGGLTDTHILDAGGAFLLAVATGLQSAIPKHSPS
jgi:O-antigen ligase